VLLHLRGLVFDDAADRRRDIAQELRNCSGASVSKIADTVSVRCFSSNSARSNGSPAMHA
jgi:hypothetical protein